MRVFTPDDVATATGSKYLGVLVSAKYARELNSLPRETLPLGEEKKLTIAALSQTLPEREKLHVTPCSAISRWNASLAYWLPRSE